MINIREASLTLSMGGTLSFFDEHCFTGSRISPQTWILPACGVPNDFFSTHGYLFKESVRYQTWSSFGARVRSRPGASGLFYPRMYM
jgi:hypothetical protein